MPPTLQCEFSLVRYVPDVVKGEFANIGVVLRESGAAAQVKFTRDWSRVRCLDPDADTELLESLEAEIAERLASGIDLRVNAKPMLETLEDTLSNSVQITEMRATLAESLPAGMEQLLRLYVEPLKAPRGQRRPSGRAGIATEMRAAFEATGAWSLMRKRIPASQYTEPGDPLKLDCGYRTGLPHQGHVRLFHAVSLSTDLEAAKGLAYSATALREGVRKLEGLDLELTAVVEPLRSVVDEDQYTFGLTAMERENIRVLTTADLPRAAETARRELRA